MALFTVPTLGRALDRNDTDNIKFFVTEPGTTVPQNITGWTFEFVVKEDESQDVALFTKTTVDGGILVTSAPNGEGEIVLDGTELTLGYPATLIGSLHMTSPDGKRQTRRVKIPYRLD